MLLAFDTGPGNMVIDAVTQRLFGKPFDRDGIIASAGEVIEPVPRRILGQSFFRAKPPKTAGSEEFGREFVAEFLRLCQGVRNEDVVATATALTARSIAEAIARFVVKRIPTSRKVNETRGSPRFHELVLSGGGARNATLVACSPNYWRLWELWYGFRTSLDCLLRRKRRLRSPCWLMRRGTGGLPICRRRRALEGRRCWGRFRMSSAGVRRQASGMPPRIGYRWTCLGPLLIVLSLPCSILLQSNPMPIRWSC